MDDAEIVSTEICKELFESYLPHRMQELNSLRPENEFSQFFQLFKNATESEKKSIQHYIEMVIADVASTILGGFDGVTDLGTLSDDFKIEYGSKDISGYLQEYFLMKVEERSDQ